MTSSPVRPAGHPLRELCESLLSRIEELSIAVTDDIRREIPSCAALPLAEQRMTVRNRLHALLRGLALDVEPTAGQLREIQAESRRRAYYGLPAQDALATFHIGARRLWDELRDAARGTAAEEADIDTLRARMVRACTEVRATVYVPELVAAWAEVRQGLFRRSVRPPRPSVVRQQLPELRGEFTAGADAWLRADVRAPRAAYTSRALRYGSGRCSRWAGVCSNSFRVGPSWPVRNGGLLQAARHQVDAPVPLQGQEQRDDGDDRQQGAGDHQ
ncbi:hypothetical protein [Streptomyces sp. Agncl-13]|uniref:hypothetical protein n=1 Tax=Streptomyces sp. Agncl-13 TaxID=3400628 RepID=UPI003A8A2F95